MKKITKNCTPPSYNLVGEKYGFLTVVSWEGKNYDHRNFWLCKCICGNTKIISDRVLRKGKSKSCGCMSKELKSKHKLIYSPEYQAWSSMKSRCYNPNKTVYKDYGGRGIYVCRRWRKSFENFYKDMGRRPTKEHSIDRIDNNYGYIPFNCRWATQKEQMNNVRTNHLISFNGETLTLIQWSRKTGINRTTIYNRINKLGWTIEKSLTTPVRKNKR